MLGFGYLFLFWYWTTMIYFLIILIIALVVLSFYLFAYTKEVENLVDNSVNSKRPDKTEQTKSSDQ